MPASPPSVLEQVLGQLWRALRAPDAATDVMGAILGQAQEFLAQEQEGSTEHARRSAEMAHILHELAERSGDQGFARKALAALCDIRPQGTLLMASCIGSAAIPDREVKHVFKGLPASTRLAVANRFLARPRHHAPKDALWTCEQVHDIQGEDPEEALVFLDGLAHTGERPSYPVQREMVHGRFGFWLQEIIGLKLNEDQVRYMLETAALLEWRPLASKLPLLLRSAGPADMPRVWRAIGQPGLGGGDKTEKAALLFLKHKDAGTRLAAVEALVNLRSTKAVPALATLCKTADLVPRAMGLALRLEAKHFHAFAAKLPPKLRPAALCVAVSLLARLYPESTSHTIGAVKAAGAKDQALAKAAAALEQLVKGRRKAAPKPAFTPAPPTAHAKSGSDGESILGKVKQLFGGKDDAGSGSGQAALDALEPGKKVSGTTLRDAEALGKNLSKVRFDKATLRSLDLRHAAMGGTRFSGCRITDVDLAQSRLKGAVFEDCEFLGCRFSGSALEGVTFTGCTFKRTHFDAVSSTKLKTVRCRFDKCLLWGLRAEWWTARTCAFTFCDLSHAALIGCDLDGMAFADCLLLDLFASDTRLFNSRSTACTASGSRVTGLVSDDPVLLEWEEHTANDLNRTAAAREKLVRPPAGLDGAAGEKALLRVADAVLHERDMARRRRIALAANRRRLDWCAAKLGTAAAGVVSMLPGMLEHPAVRTVEGLQSAPSCIIEGYLPDLDVRERLDKHFEIDPAKKQPKTPPPTIRIEAFYSIGSVGTIAQTRGSDIDMWVCFDETAVDPKDAKAFRAKLAAIEKWADDEYGMELHFFVMDIAKVRENNFGFSDKESAGSSQALLLKEEFYRTAVLLAGKKLAWWLAPTGATGPRYAKALARISAAAAIPDNDTVDLGAMEGIPRGEFFGASLWQIVKALKSPFKSIMKFALLDAYLAGGGSDVLLCNRLKHSLSNGRRDFWSVDPYAVLYRDIDTHYAKQGNADARKLLRMAFEQKTGFSEQGRTSGRQADLRGHSYLEYHFPHAVDEQPGGAPSPSARKERPTFASFHDLGQKVARFMFATYQSIHKATSAIDDDATITGEDLTRLGRRIIGQFQPKEGKILRTPFVDSPAKLFGSLEIMCEGIPGMPLNFVARGEHIGPGSGKGEYEELHRDRHPVRLLTWCVANQIHTSGMQVLGKDLRAPISVPDLRALADDLVSFLDLHDVFDPEIEATLRREEMTKAFISINFLTDRDIKDYKDVVLVYSTSWGELFCITRPKGIEYLEKDVREFLAANSQARIPAEIDLFAHLPGRAQAPRPVLV